MNDVILAIAAPILGFLFYFIVASIPIITFKAIKGILMAVD